MNHIQRTTVKVLRREKHTFKILFAWPLGMHQWAFADLCVYSAYDSDAFVDPEKANSEQRFFKCSKGLITHPRVEDGPSLAMFS